MAGYTPDASPTTPELIRAAPTAQALTPKGSPAKAITAAERLEYGTVGINNVAGGEVAFPYGGWKQSGIGVENSSHAVEEYLQMKHIRIDIGEG
jgi:acyl-CoA reductase-like NAD-dependent aldehyde dehydrogenase